MVFAEVLGGDEDVVVAGGVEPVMDIHQSEAEGTFAMGEPVAGRTS